ncbi:MAG: thiol-disulfide isomerase/thioredoxin [Planctomycetota bacterium]
MLDGESVLAPGDGARGPVDGARGPGEDYSQGWIAINRLMRSGWSWSGNEAHTAFLNLGPGPDGIPRFVDASNAIGFDAISDGRAAVRMDLDLDGDLDLLVTSRDGPRLRALRNDLQASGRFVALRLSGQAHNPTAVGARIEIRLPDDEGGTRRLVRSVRAGEGFIAQQPAWVHFGLGTGSSAATEGSSPAPLDVHVRWPDGSSETFDGVYPGDWSVLTKGLGKAQTWTPPRLPSALIAGAYAAPEPASAARIVLPKPMPLPTLDLLAGDGTRTSLFGIREGGVGRGTGRPLLLNLWASWCTPCIAELSDLRDSADKFGRLGILALSVDEGDQAEDAKRILERLDWRFPAGFAPAATRDTIDVIMGALLDTSEPLSIPLSLLVNSKGELVVVYVGRLKPERLLADLTLLETDAATRAYATTRFPGTWYRAPELPSAATMEARMRSRGLERQAVDFGRARLQVAEDAGGRVYYSMAKAAMARLEEAEDGGENPEALADIIRLLQRAVALDTTLFDAQADLGVALHRQGDYALAVDAYSAALLLLNDAGVRAKRGLSFLLLERFDLVERELEGLRAMGAHEAESLALELENARRR